MQDENLNIHNFRVKVLGFNPSLFCFSLGENRWIERHWTGNIIFTFWALQGQQARNVSNVLEGVKKKKSIAEVLDVATEMGRDKVKM